MASLHRTLLCATFYRKTDQGFSAATVLLEPPRMNNTYAPRRPSTSLADSSLRTDRKVGMGSILCTARCAPLHAARADPAPRPATEGNITYTWVEDDARKKVTASFVVMLG